MRNLPAAAAPRSAEEGATCTRGQALLALAVMLVLLYVLSVGPIVHFTERTKIARKPAAAVYAPLRWLHRHTPLKKPLEWYVEIWDWNRETLP